MEKLYWFISYITCLILLYFIKPKFILKEKTEDKTIHKTNEIHIIKLVFYSLIFATILFLILSYLFLSLEKKHKKENVNKIETAVEEPLFKFICY